MSNLATNPLIKDILKTAPVRTYSLGQTIVYPQEESAELYILKQGAVSLETITDLGDKQILYIFGSTSLFPMTSFQEDSVSSAWYYMALTHTEVYVISYKVLKEALKDQDGYATYNLLLNQLLQEFRELLFHISSHSHTNSKDKLISVLQFLLTYHTKTTSSKWRVIPFPITHKLLAEMTGMARETVTLTLKELVKLKVVRLPHNATLEIHIDNLSQHFSRNK